MPPAERILYDYGGMQIRKLVSEAGRREAAAMMAASDPWRRLGLGFRACRAGLDAPYRETYAARLRGGYAGHVTLNMAWPLGGYIQTLFVPDGFRGRGIGEGLLRFAEDRIFRSSPNVFLCVSSFNREARRFYSRHGYEKAGLLGDFIIKGAGELLLRKTSGPLSGYAARRKEGKHGRL